jgi:hypothetical protein
MVNLTSDVVGSAAACGEIVGEFGLEPLRSCCNVASEVRLQSLGAVSKIAGQLAPEPLEPPLEEPAEQTESRSDYRAGAGAGGQHDLEPVGHHAKPTLSAKRPDSARGVFERSKRTVVAGEIISDSISVRGRGLEPPLLSEPDPKLDKYFNFFAQLVS